MKLIIEGNTPSQKNGKNIVFNPRTGRRFIVSNPRVVAWHKSAKLQLQAQKIAIEPPFALRVVFYRDTARKYDLDNAYSSIADALVHAGVIEDDNNTIISEVLLRHGGIDKLNARAEIFISE